MGRFSKVLAPQFADFAGVSGKQQVLDVGCGSGALTTELARRLGPEAVTALDPSEQFVMAVRERCRGVSVHRGFGERLPFADGTFDVAAAQLAVGFMQDPAAALRELTRVTVMGGVVALCEWQFGLPSPVEPFWRAASELDADIAPAYGSRTPSRLRYAKRLQGLGLLDVEDAELQASIRYERFDDWWEPATQGVGPSASYARRLDPQSLVSLRERCSKEFPPDPFTFTAVARATRGVVP